MLYFLSSLLNLGHLQQIYLRFQFIISGLKRKGLSNASYNVDKQVTEDAETPEDDGSRLVLSGGEGYVDFRIGRGTSNCLMYFLFHYFCFDGLNVVQNVEICRQLTEIKNVSLYFHNMLIENQPFVQQIDRIV